MNIGTAGGKLFLLYNKSEEATIRKMGKHLTTEGIIAIQCKDPANFRFVTPEVVQATPENMDLIGRTALKHLGAYDAEKKFVKDLNLALNPPSEGKSA